MTDKQIIEFTARKTGLKPGQIRITGELLEGGATVPFIARYRQEATEGLDEQQIRSIQDVLSRRRELEERRSFILETIESQGKLTGDLRSRIEASEDITSLEDLYLPYKPKRKTRADKAAEKGLEPLADLVWEQQTVKGDPQKIAAGYVNNENEVGSPEEALAGARDIVAERISQQPEVRELLRVQFRKFGSLGSKLAGEKGRKKDEKQVFETYYDFTCKVKHLRPHQILAIDRGEREGVLRVSVEIWEERTLEKVDRIVISNENSIFVEELEKAVTDAWKRLLFPSLERELRSELTEQAGEHAIEMFAENVRNLLLQPPVKSSVVLGIDPAYRTGCKIALVDQTGRFIEGGIVYPTLPHNRVEEAKQTIGGLIKKYDVDLIAIGNGTGSRETEQVVSELIGEMRQNGEAEELSWLIVSEAGASVYSASEVAREEFPDLEASQRGNISIARRVLDPLAELVKIDPKSIGVGLYQHDVNQTRLGKKLDEVVESCVNHVGVNLNSASASLLNYVSGLGRFISKEIVHYREQIGRFTSREQLMDVAGLGPFRYEQAAGFLRIPDGGNPLDNTAIHPESYDATERLCRLLDLDLSRLSGNPALLEERLKGRNRTELAEEIGVGEPTLELIIGNLQKPGRDPRDEMSAPMLRQDILSLEDLSSGARLQGTVRNVVDFGAFVDIGVKVDGLLHVSKMRKDGGRVENVLEEVRVGEVIDVEVEKVDVKRQRISLKRV